MKIGLKSGRRSRAGKRKLKGERKVRKQKVKRIPNNPGVISMHNWLKKKRLKRSREKVVKMRTSLPHRGMSTAGRTAQKFVEIMTSATEKDFVGQH
jgi:hypothetical protein